MNTLHGHQKTSETGSVSTEFAVTLPAVVLFLVLILGVGMIGSSQVALEEGARAAARELARGENQETASATALRVSGRDPQISFAGQGEFIEVTVSEPARLLGLVELDYVQSARATVRAENVSPLPRGTP